MVRCWSNGQIFIEEKNKTKLIITILLDNIPWDETGSTQVALYIKDIAAQKSGMLTTLPVFYVTRAKYELLNWFWIVWLRIENQLLNGWMYEPQKATWISVSVKLKLEFPSNFCYACTGRNSMMRFYKYDFFAAFGLIYFRSWAFIQNHTIEYSHSHSIVLV